MHASQDFAEVDAAAMEGVAYADPDEGKKRKAAQKPKTSAAV